MAPGLVRRLVNRIRCKGSGHSLVRTRFLAAGITVFAAAHTPESKSQAGVANWSGLGKAMPWVHDR